MNTAAKVECMRGPECRLLCLNRERRGTKHLFFSETFTKELPSMAKVMALLRAGIDDLRAPSRGNIPAPDVLRSAAILMVFAVHPAHWNHATACVANSP